MHFPQPEQLEDREDFRVTATMIKSAKLARKHVLKWFEKNSQAVEAEGHWGGSITVRSVAKWINYMSTKV
jgi:hypothetical protein